MTKTSPAYPSGLHYQELEAYIDAHATAMASHRAWIKANKLAVEEAHIATKDKKQHDALRKQYRTKYFEKLEPQHVADTAAIAQHKKKVLSQWKEFAQQNTDKLEDINLLHDIAFKPQGATQIARPEYLNSRLESASLAMSHFARDADKRDFKHIVEDALVKQWIELEKEHGLFPPTTLYAEQGKKAAILAKRKALLASSEGKLLSDILWALNHDAVEQMVSTTQNRLQHTRHRFCRDDITFSAHQLFITSLFSHDDSKKSSFHGHLYTNLKVGLYDQVLKDIRPDRILTTSLDAKRGRSEDGYSLLHMLAAPKENDDGIIHTDSASVILGRAALNPKQMQVLRMRFGLDGQESLTLDEAGLRLGVSRERVRQIEAIALEKLQAAKNQGFTARIAPQKVPLSEDIVQCKQRLRTLLLGEPDQEITIGDLSIRTGIAESRLSSFIGKDARRERALKETLSDNVCATLNVYLHSQDRPAAEIEELNQTFAELRKLVGWKGLAETSAGARL